MNTDELYWVVCFYSEKVGSQSQQILQSSTSIDQDDENQVIERALNQSDVSDHQQQPVSVFDLSPMLASGCAV